MSSAKFRREFLTDAGWWHWALTVPLVAAHLAGHRGAILAVMALCGVAGVYSYARIPCRRFSSRASRKS